MQVLVYLKHPPSGSAVPQRLGCPHSNLGHIAVDFHWSQDGQTTDIQTLISAIWNMRKRHLPPHPRLFLSDGEMENPTCRTSCVGSWRPSEDTFGAVFTTLLRSTPAERKMGRVLRSSKSLGQAVPAGGLPSRVLPSIAQPQAISKAKPQMLSLNSEVTALI